MDERSPAAATSAHLALVERVWPPTKNYAGEYRGRCLCRRPYNVTKYPRCRCQQHPLARHHPPETELVRQHAARVEPAQAWQWWCGESPSVRLKRGYGNRLAQHPHARPGDFYRSHVWIQCRSRTVPAAWAERICDDDHSPRQFPKEDAQIPFTRLWVAHDRGQGL